MRMILTMALTVLLSYGQAMAAENTRDDGGFGSSRFSAQAPSALGGTADIGTTNVIAVVPEMNPAEIEPAAGEEDIRPDVEILHNGQVLQNSEHEAEPVIIQKDLTIR